MATILIADDHLLVRDTIAAYLTRKGRFIIHAVADLEEAFLVLSDHNQIDLAIFDYQMPGMDGLEGLKQVRDKYPDLKTAIMSGVAASGVVDEALELGALAFFPKSMSVGLMVEGIREILSNSDGCDADTFDDSTEDPDGNRFGLTPREAQILDRLAQGQSNKVIAHDLDLKEVTVKFHVSNIMTKLGVTNRTQAALLAKDALES